MKTKDYGINSITDAFLALNDILDEEIKVNNLKERSKLKEAASVDVNNIEDIDAAEKFRKSDVKHEDSELEVIDVDADAVDQLKDGKSYIGKMLLQCNSCKATRFLDADKLKVDENDDELYNTEDECPHCHNVGTGYTLIGQVGKKTDETSDEANIDNDVNSDEEAMFDNTDEVEPEAEENSEEETSNNEDTEENNEETNYDETNSDDDTNNLDLPKLGDEFDVDDVVEDDTEEESDDEDKKKVKKESLNESADSKLYISTDMEIDIYEGGWIYFELPQENKNNETLQIIFDYTEDDIENVISYNKQTNPKITFNLWYTDDGLSAEQIIHDYNLTEANLNDIVNKLHAEADKIIYDFVCDMAPDDYFNESYDEPDEDDEYEDEFDADHAAEWMERHPHGYYNNENDYGWGEDEDERIRRKSQADDIEEDLDMATFEGSIANLIDTFTIEDNPVNIKLLNKNGSELGMYGSDDLPFNVKSQMMDTFNTDDNYLEVNVTEDGDGTTVNDLFNYYRPDEDNQTTFVVTNVDTDEEEDFEDLTEFLEKYGDYYIDGALGLRTLNIYIADGDLETEVEPLDDEEIEELGKENAEKEEAEVTEESLIEEIINSYPGLKLNRINNSLSEEYFIADSIRLNEDIDLVYKNFVKPTNNEKLIEHFKSYTGYEDEVDKFLKEHNISKDKYNKIINEDVVTNASADWEIPQTKEDFAKYVDNDCFVILNDGTLLEGIIKASKLYPGEYTMQYDEDSWYKLDIKDIHKIIKYSDWRALPDDKKIVDKDTHKVPDESLNEKTTKLGKFIYDDASKFDIDLPTEPFKVLLVNQGAYDLEQKGKSGHFTWVFYEHPGKYGRSQKRMNPIIEDVAYQIADIYKERYGKEAVVEDHINRLDMFRVYVETNEEEKVNEKLLTSVKTRAELGEAINKLVEAKQKYHIKKSVNEGYRYDIFVNEDCNEGLFDSDKVDLLDDGDAEAVDTELVDQTPTTNVEEPVETTDIVPDDMRPEDIEIVQKIDRIANDISNAVEDIYNIEAPKNLIVADIIQDLQLIGGEKVVDDLEDTPINQVTKKMYQEFNGFYDAMDEMISFFTGERITTSQADRLADAIASLDSNQFSTETIREKVASPQFIQAARAGYIPFIDPTLLNEPTDESLRTFDEDYNTEDRLAELKKIQKERKLTDDEAEELAYCENEVDSRRAEQNYLNGIKEEIELNDDNMSDEDCERRLSELLYLQDQRELTDDEKEELAYCENRISEKMAEDETKNESNEIDLEEFDNCINEYLEDNEDDSMLYRSLEIEKLEEGLKIKGIIEGLRRDQNIEFTLKESLTEDASNTRKFTVTNNLNDSEFNLEM